MERQYLTWQEAVKAAQEGKKLLFHYNGKAVPVDKDTTIQSLQWEHFDILLSWNDIFSGKFSIVEGE